MQRYDLFVLEIGQTEYADLAAGRRLDPSAIYIVDGILRGPLSRTTRTSSISASRFWGAAANMSIDAMMFWSKRTPGRYNKAQLIVHGERNTVGIAGSFSPSAAFGTGVNPVNAAGANIAPLAFTWGTTDPNDFGNPGGGAAFGAITNASGAQNYPATAGWREGDVASDWLDVESLDSTDSDVNRAYAFARWQGLFNNTGSTQTISGVSVPDGNRTPGYRDTSNQELFSGTWGTDGPLTEPQNVMGYATGSGRLLTAGLSSGVATLGTVGSISGVATLRLVHTDVRPVSIIVGGDSLVQGYFSGQGAGVDGWAHKAKGYIIDAGFWCEIVSDYWTTEKADNTHWKLERAIRNRSGTHIAIPMYSINDNALGDAGFRASLNRASRLVAMAEQAGIVPIPFIPMTGVADWDARMLAAAAQYRKGGVRVLDIPALVGKPDRMSVKDEYKPRFDNNHYYDPFHTVVGRSFAALVLY